MKSLQNYFQSRLGTERNTSDTDAQGVDSSVSSTSVYPATSISHIQQQLNELANQILDLYALSLRPFTVNRRPYGNPHS